MGGTCQQREGLLGRGMISLGRGGRSPSREGPTIHREHVVDQGLRDARLARERRSVEGERAQPCCVNENVPPPTSVGTVPVEGDPLLPPRGQVSLKEERGVREASAT